ncbi:hypothetical protein SAMN05444673_2758 [Bacillus sp. OV166]|uniref:hypothetical protein n=1 Tax=Bacillus sp. OV166 TaxID=1882763 RepID=UPI000A2AB299|nr:hypothetical protein [Bacillus sp. OV166]SMQ77434.1 hypothetical protein SAMN05444673_2758 [Bacillus sp. OV166]
MDKEKKNVPQEFQNNVNDHKNSKTNLTANLEDNDIQPDSAIITGGGDPNLSPDSGRPLI